MSAKYPFSMWVYNPLSDFPPEELESWAECGMTAPLAPKTYYGKDDPKTLIPYLDKAEELGMQLIVNYEDFAYQNIDRIGDDAYEAKFREVYEVLKGHPALYGFYAGDEPNCRRDFDQTRRCIAIQNKVAPELKSYVNLISGMANKDRDELLDMTLEEWFCEMKSVGCEFVSQDAYEPMINDHTVTDYFRDMKKIIEAAEKAGVDIWTNMLCSGHDAFRAPSESDVIWQLNVGAALGCRGGIWFRFYDRKMGFDYFGSPVDEFGNKTNCYYAILRAQRRFNNHYGELLMKLKRKSTYMTGYKKRGVYPELHENVHDIVKISGYEEGVISFFEDENGNEYFAIANASLEFRASWDISFDSDKGYVLEVSDNGRHERVIGGPECAGSNTTFYVGQFRLFRIHRN
jgi:hypothetical protein